MENKELARLKKAKDANELKEVFKSFNLPLTDEEAKDYFAILQKKGKMANNELSNISGGGCTKWRKGRAYSGDYKNHNGEFMLIVTVTNQCSLHVSPLAPDVVKTGPCQTCMFKRRYRDSVATYCARRTYDNDPLNPK